MAGSTGYPDVLARTASAWLEGLDEAERGYAEVARAIAEFEDLTMIARSLRDENGSSALERLKNASFQRRTVGPKPR